MTTLEELKDICREQNPEMFLLGNEELLLASVERHIMHESLQALIFNNAGLQAKLLHLNRMLSQNKDLEGTGEYHLAEAEAHSHFAELFRRWRDELANHSNGVTQHYR